MTSTQQFCTFLLDGHLFGAPVSKVQEVMPWKEMTRVPLAPEVIPGLMNLRGQIVMAIDLRRQLGLQERPAGQQPMNVVVLSSNGAISLLVDEIGEVLEVENSTFERPPETLTGFLRTAVCGVYKLPGRLLLALDVDRTVDVGNPSKAKSDPSCQLKISPQVRQT